MEVCRLSGSCLKCRFVRCVYDRPWGKRQQLKNRRNRNVLRLFQLGKDTRELARMFGVSRRTVQRAVKERRRNDQ